MNHKGAVGKMKNDATTLTLHHRTTVKKRLFRLITYLFLSLTAMMIILPFVQLILASFKSAQEINLDTIFPREWKFSNYKIVLQETVILRSFVNTFTYIIPPVVVGTFMSALCAYGFARLKFPGKKLIFTLMMGTLVIPNIIIMVPAYVMF